MFSTDFQYPKKAVGEWIGYINDSVLYIENLKTEKKSTFQHVIKYLFDPKGNSVVMETFNNSSSSRKYEISYLNLKSGQLKVIYSDKDSLLKSSIKTFSFSNTGNNILIHFKGTINGDVYRIYNISTNTNCIALDQSNKFLQKGYKIIEPPRLSQNDQFMLLRLKRDRKEQRDSLKSSFVQVWNYKDPIIYPERQLLEEMYPSYLDIANYQSIVVVINLNTQNSVQITKESELLSPWENDFYAIVMDRNNVKESWWSWEPQPSYYLVSFIDGSRRLLKEKGFNLSSVACKLRNVSFSPCNKYVSFWDADSSAYYVFNLSSGQLKNVTKSIDANFSSRFPNGLYPDPTVKGWFGVWQDDGSFIYLYDQYDLWRFDPEGVKMPICLTKGYGKKHHVQLRVATDDNLHYKFNKDEKSIMFVGLDDSTKYNGFYMVNMKAIDSPRVLYSGPYVFSISNTLQLSNSGNFDLGMAPIKATDVNAWLVKRQSSTEAPNYFYTTDFKNFEKITDVQPQQKYNWLTTELVTWELSDGTVCQGVLYKPENFDKTKKYPVIFSYYQKESHLLYQFPTNGLISGDLKVSWFVSRGYLVFKPDIHYSKSFAESGIVSGKAALNSVVSAANYLSRFPFIDKDHMALMGHSFGGFQTNYIITHSNIFAAAFEFAGVTDFLSHYLSLAPFLSSEEHSIGQDRIEIGGLGAGSMGGNPWDFPSLYQRNSPVLSLDKVSTPLLMVHNRTDNQIPYHQGVELFLGLRRLNKPVWFLQYKSGGHTLDDKKEQADLTLKLTEYFDYYIKGKAKPDWMLSDAEKEVETNRN
ncbi:Prolyl oligopeptidase family protein [bacterium A37T11]|nr:Prolyl oligopeptidase family protein [bacterium A37T11]